MVALISILKINTLLPLERKVLFTVIAENAAMLDVKEGVLQGVTTEAEHVSSQLLFALNIVNEELTNPHCHMSGQ